MGIEELLLPLREEILKIAAQYGAYNVRVFGSVARGEARLDSDVDFLVEIEPQRTLLDQIGLMQSLEELLKRKVDIAEPDTLHEIIREKVLKEAVVSTFCRTVMQDGSIRNDGCLGMADNV